MNFIGFQSMHVCTLSSFLMSKYTASYREVVRTVDEWMQEMGQEMREMREMKGR